jgi:hypothetical protein
MTPVQPEIAEPDIVDHVVDSGSTDGHSDADGHCEPRLPLGSPGPLYRYRNSGNLVLSAGIITGIVTYCWGLLPAWAGFLAGALSVSIVTAIIQAKNDALRSAGRTTCDR